MYIKFIFWIFWQLKLIYLYEKSKSCSPYFNIYIFHWNHKEYFFVNNDKYFKKCVLHHENKRTKTRERKQERENKRVKLETYFSNISHECLKKILIF